MNTTEQDQHSKLSLDFKIINFLANTIDYTDRTQLATSLSNLYIHFKIHRQKKDVTDADFKEYLEKN